MKVKIQTLVVLIRHLFNFDNSLFIYMKKIILELKKIPNGHLDREWIGYDAINKEWFKNYSNEDKRKYLKVIGRDDLSPTKDW